ncbi:MAG: TonB family protein [Bacteroidales bacterium]
MMIEEVIIYLLKVSLGLGIISLSYFLFRNDAGLGIKRFYLLSGIIACWIFPLLHFPLLVNFSGAEPAASSSVSLSVSPGQEAVASSDEGGQAFNWPFLAAVIYISGMLFILFRNIGLINRWRLRRKNGVNGSDNIIFTEEEKVFTLFRWIFLPAKFRNDPSFDSIILHEKAHVEQLHFIDLIIIELTLLFTWFNPFTWLISGMIKENHEHLADRKVLAGGINPAHYRAQLLNFTLGTTYFRLGHQFNHSLTKTRFKMMKKTVTKKAGILKYILVLPVIITALMIFTGSTVQDQDGSVKGKVYFSDTGSPAHGASVIIKGTTTGTVIDKNGEFALDYEGDPPVVISFVGYETVEMKASEIGKKPINLEVKSYKLDPGSVPDGANKGSVSGVKADRQEGEVFIVVEEMPEFPGGMEALRTYIYDNLEYPGKAKRKGIEGEATIGFTVNTDGGIEDINIVDSSHKGFGEAAMKVFNDMPEWEPGKQRGRPVKVKLHIPVEFKPDRE